MGMRISVFPKGQLDALVVDRILTVFDWITMAKVLPIEGLELYSRMFDDTSDSFVDRVGDALQAANLEMPEPGCGGQGTRGERMSE
jgi:hypothetical protein